MGLGNSLAACGIHVHLANAMHTIWSLKDQILVLSDQRKHKAEYCLSFVLNYGCRSSRHSDWLSIGGNNITLGSPGKRGWLTGKSGFVITAGAVGSSPQSFWQERCLFSPFPFQITQSRAPTSMASSSSPLPPHPPLIFTVILYRFSLLNPPWAFIYTAFVESAWLQNRIMCMKRLIKQNCNQLRGQLLVRLLCYLLN